MEKKIRSGHFFSLSHTFFFIVTGLLCFSLLFLERSNVQLIILLLSFLCAGFMLKRKTLYVFIASIIVLFLVGIKEIAENEDTSVKIIKKFFVFPGEENSEDD